jgi:hypothetical protein
VLSYFHCVFSVILVNVLYHVKFCEEIQRILRGGCMHATPPPESAPVDSHILMRHIHVYRIWVQNLKKIKISYIVYV